MGPGNFTFGFSFKQCTIAIQFDMCFTTTVSNQPLPFTHVVQSPMLSGDGSFLDSYGDDDDQAANTIDFSQPMYHTPPPPPTQETQTDSGEAIYGRGFRDPRPPRQRLSPSGPRPRKIQTRRRQ
jgi:hypothetical protein